MDYRKQMQKIDTMLHKIGAQKAPIDTQVRIFSKTRDIDYTYTSRTARPFHAASVGKVFVSALLVRFADQGKLALDQHVNKFLPASILRGLFVVDGTDYAAKVTIRHLATHTSGINDYFDSKSSEGSSFIGKVIAEPDHLWSPDELIAYTREFQTAVAKPGEKFFYSDTGYVLLGKILEKVSGKEYWDLLQQEIFQPLSMNSTYLFGSPSGSKVGKMAPLYVNGVDVSTMTSLSCDWSGGGVVTTVHDLLLFQKALINGRFGNLLPDILGNSIFVF